ncbi:MAG TPA: alpha/beta fold hydrolase [Polyangiaceae bacterium]|jgi:polyhydroxybutyrate depolymerase
MGARIAAVLLTLAAAACGRAGAKPSGESPSEKTPALVAARPYTMHVPATHEAAAPLVIVLHGFGADHDSIDRALQATALGATHGAFVALPDGTANPRGSRFWNASDACCDFWGAGVDDVAYLDALIDDAVARYPIDPSRVYVMGFSNGGFMAHRYACDRAERVAGVVAFAGEPWKDANKCHPKVPVTVLQVHGDADDIVRYQGGRASDSRAFRSPEFARAGAFPAARDGIAMWGKLDGCFSPTTTDDAHQEKLFYDGCAQGAEVQLWTRHGIGHTIDLSRPELESIWQLLLAHHR